MPYNGIVLRHLGTLRFLSKDATINKKKTIWLFDLGFLR